MSKRSPKNKAELSLSKTASLSSWLEYISELHASEIDLGLDRIRSVYQLLEVQDFDVPVVTFAGTNGKGTTLGLVEQLAIASKIKVAAYTSPHILSFNERVRVNGEAVSDELLCNAFSKIESVRGNIQLTYFEFTTLAAFLIFHWQAPEVILLEVGLGGRLDAVNLIDADIAVITSISLDHQEWLGSNLEDIAREKAGILRPGIPLVCGLKGQLPASMLDIVNHYHCTMIGEASLKTELSEGKWSLTCEAVEGKVFSMEAWQIKNLPMANLPLMNATLGLLVWRLVSLHYLTPCRPESSWNEAMIRSVLRVYTLPGRWQKVQCKAMHAFLDVAHNEEAAYYLKQNIMKLKTQLAGQAHRVISVFGAMKDKEIETLIRVLAPDVDLWLPMALPVDRAASIDEITALLMNQKANIGQPIEDLQRDWWPMEKMLDSNRDIVVFWGSFYVVAEVLRLFHNK